MRFSSASPNQTNRKTNQFSPSNDNVENQPRLNLIDPNSFSQSPQSSAKLSRSSSASRNSTPRGSITGSGRIRVDLTPSSLASFGVNDTPGHLQRSESSQSRSKLFETTFSVESVDDDVASSVRIQVRNQVFKETRVYQDLLSHDRKNQTKRIATLLETISKFTRSPNRVQIGLHKLIIPEAVTVIHSPESMLNSDFNCVDLGLTESEKRNPTRRKMAEVQKLAVIEKTPYRRQESLLERSVGIFRRSRSSDPHGHEDSDNISNTRSKRSKSTGPSSWGTSSRWSSSSSKAETSPVSSLSSRLESLSKPRAKAPLKGSSSSSTANSSSPSHSQTRPSSPRQRPGSAHHDTASVRSHDSVASSSGNMAKVPSAFDRLFMKSIRPPKQLPPSPQPTSPLSAPASPRMKRDSTTSNTSNSTNNRTTARRTSNSSLKSM